MQSWRNDIYIRSRCEILYHDSCYSFVCSLLGSLQHYGLHGSQRIDWKGETCQNIFSCERTYRLGFGRRGSRPSMGHKRSLCLYGEDTRLARLDASFTVYKPYEQWIGGGNQVSYRAELSSQLLVYTDGILKQIGPSSFKPGWNAVVSFFDMFYLKLLAICKFDPAVKIWMLVALCASWQSSKLPSLFALRSYFLRI
jgi:hypothetical protein